MEKSSYFEVGKYQKEAEVWKNESMEKAGGALSRARREVWKKVWKKLGCMQKLVQPRKLPLFLTFESAFWCAAGAPSPAPPAPLPAPQAPLGFSALGACAPYL